MTTSSSAFLQFLSAKLLVTFLLGFLERDLLRWEEGFLFVCVIIISNISYRGTSDGSVSVRLFFSVDWNFFVFSLKACVFVFWGPPETVVFLLVSCPAAKFSGISIQLDIHVKEGHTAYVLELQYYSTA
eukprot:jgi/Phyca11/14445/fgenesh1_pg.PHYCAscaffold_7_\